MYEGNIGVTVILYTWQKQYHIYEKDTADATGVN